VIRCEGAPDGESESALTATPIIARPPSEVNHRPVPPRKTPRGAPPPTLGGPVGCVVISRPALAERLDLQPHPEGGWFRETYRSTHTFRPAGYDGARSAATAIYFLLHPGERSRWHTVRSDELWFWHNGGPLTLTLAGAGPEPAEPANVTLGPDVAAGHVPQALVPAGVWQAAEPAGTEPALVSCVVAPGFEYADFRLL